MANQEETGVRFAVGLYQASYPGNKPISDVDKALATLDPCVEPFVIEPGPCQGVVGLPSFGVAAAFVDSAVEFTQGFRYLTFNVQRSRDDAARLDSPSDWA